MCGFFQNSIVNSENCTMAGGKNIPYAHALECVTCENLYDVQTQAWVEEV